MIRAAVLGSPISHSLSPLMHKCAFEKLSLQGDYEAFDVTEDQLSNFLSSHEDMTGFSLTMPLKERAAELADKKSTRVESTGSANTLIREGNSWFAENTDSSGFDFLFKSALQIKPGEKVAIIGAGGTARAALFAAKSLGLSTNVFRRSATRDLALKRIDNDCQIYPWDELESSYEFDLIINATPNGALEQISLQLKAKAVLDSLYHPSPTDFSSQFKNASRNISGEYLLAAQGLEQISLFTRANFDRNELFEYLLSKLKQALHKD